MFILLVRTLRQKRLLNATILSNCWTYNINNSSVYVCM